MKKILSALCATVLLLAFCGCDEEEPAQTIIPARDNANFRIEDVRIADLPTETKSYADWSPDDRYLLLGKNDTGDIAMYGLLQTKEGGEVAGDVGVIFRDGEHLEFFKWKYYNFTTPVPQFYCEDLDGDGDIEAALTLHTAAVQTMYVLEKTGEGQWERHQLTKSRIDELIAADTAWHFSEDKTTCYWTAGDATAEFKASSYFEDLQSYDPAGTYTFTGDNILGTYVIVQEGKQGQLQLAYVIGYDVTDGSNVRQEAYDTLYADIHYNLDGTFTFDNYYFSAEG